MRLKYEPAAEPQMVPESGFAAARACYLAGVLACHRCVSLET